MRKRKRAAGEGHSDSKRTSTELRNGTSLSKTAETESPKPFAVQIIAGTYERVLHGIAATVKAGKDSKDRGHDAAVDFSHTFLFNAHSSAIRCLSLSPLKGDKLTLASGGSDHTVNLYQLSARQSSVTVDDEPSLPSLAGRKIIQNPKNRELGSLQHHAASVNALKFPTRSKLLSAADDNTIAVARTRDWTILSTIKVPIPKAHGRPNGDTAPLGGTPAGVNDFAIHPSMKLMVSVSKGENCMRLWNLVTGKKAGVLNFEKSLLQAVGEGRWGRGEGFRVEWNSLGEEFVVAFERGAAVFGLDSKPKGIIKASPSSKFHQIHYVDHNVNEQINSNILAVSTEDGRVIFFSTSLEDSREGVSSNQSQPIPVYSPIGAIGGVIEGPRSRIKDFEFLRVPGSDGISTSSLIVTASSEGSILLWTLNLEAGLERLRRPNLSVDHSNSVNNGHEGQDGSEAVPQLGQVLGKYETGNRITCLKAFIMAATDEDDSSRLAMGDAVDVNSGFEDTSDDVSL